MPRASLGNYSRATAIRPAQTGPAIPHISHDQPLTAASGGIWLHARKPNQGRQSIPELVLWLVAGVGFEPT
jgi:hypothetical protein